MYILGIIPAEFFFLILYIYSVMYMLGIIPGDYFFLVVNL